MQNAFFMKCSYAIDNVFANRPNFILVEIFIFLDFLFYSARQVTIRCKLHDRTKRFCIIIKEGLFVLDHIGVIDWSEDADFIQCILFVLLLQVIIFHSLESVLLVAFESVDLLYDSEWAFSKFLDHYEISEGHAYVNLI